MLSIEIIVYTNKPLNHRPEILNLLPYLTDGQPQKYGFIYLQLLIGLLLLEFLSGMDAVKIPHGHHGRYGRGPQGY
ncbi:hypothetical protein Syn8016DRAFT_1662 [Synechococcus sp. WH 8016]|nr:hypothetical protein Syn8016DRAFT_1662 [Synechococcus sp. WH 8016]